MVQRLQFSWRKRIHPFDILLFIAYEFDFRAYWWESGTPFSLIQLLKKGNYYLPELENLVVDSTILSSFDIENLQLEPLLYQAGYLTIDKILEFEEIKEYSSGYRTKKYKSV